MLTTAPQVTSSKEESEKAEEKKEKEKEEKPEEGRKEVEVTKGVLTTVATGTPVFLDGDLEVVRSKIPLIDKVLSISNPNQVAKAIDAAPDVAMFDGTIG
ncbi:hypothetical protein TSMEX_010680 [Taenia solium]|eukprot:TsM_001105200 transcript=TsM_001105200 gene=TsM_001105200